MIRAREPFLGSFPSEVLVGAEEENAKLAALLEKKRRLLGKA